MSIPGQIATALSLWIDRVACTLSAQLDRARLGHLRVEVHLVVRHTLDGHHLGAAAAREEGAVLAQAAQQRVVLHEVDA